MLASSHCVHHSPPTVTQQVQPFGIMRSESSGVQPLLSHERSLAKRQRITAMSLWVILYFETVQREWIWGNGGGRVCKDERQRQRPCANGAQSGRNEEKRAILLWCWLVIMGVTLKLLCARTWVKGGGGRMQLLPQNRSNDERQPILPRRWWRAGRVQPPSP